MKPALRRTPFLILAAMLLGVGLGCPACIDDETAMSQMDAGTRARNYILPQDAIDATMVPVRCHRGAGRRRL